MSFFSNLKKAISNPFTALCFLLGVTETHSQFAEDRIIDWLILKDNNGIVKPYKGLYIDIGGNDPVYGNNTYYFYRKGWRGITIEPNKKLIKKFHNKRPLDTNLQIAAGKNNSELTFYSFRVDAVSTCDPLAAERYQEAGHILVDEYTVPVRTLEKICDTYVKDKQIDILSVDVEGLDMDVLKSNNRAKYNPIYIIVETVENSKDGRMKQSEIFDPYLKSKGYAVVSETGVNTIYKKI